MASNRIGFRQFLGTVKQGQTIDIIIDSNILIAKWDELHTNHDEINLFLNSLDEIANVNFYTTVTTKSEVLDYQRRRLLTYGLLSLLEMSSLELAPVSRAKIGTVKGRKNTREKHELKRSQKEGDEVDSHFLYFRDSEIKEIKKAFRARDIQNIAGWLTICDVFLGKRLLREEELIDELCIYLSPYKEEQFHIFNRKVDWKNATAISAKSGMGFSDSMILNMVLATKIDYILTLDCDLVYASAVSAPNKTVIIPDKRIKQFKQTLKRI